MGTLETIMKQYGMSEKMTAELLDCTLDELAAYCSGRETLNRERLQKLQRRYKWSAEYTQTIKEFMLFDTYNYYIGIYKKTKLMLSGDVKNRRRTFLDPSVE